MGILAWVFGSIGGLSMVMGIITAVGAVPEVAGLTWMFWFVLAAILVLISIVFAIGRGSSYE